MVYNGIPAGAGAVRVAQALVRPAGRLPIEGAAPPRSSAHFSPEASEQRPPCMASKACEPVKKARSLAGNEQGRCYTMFDDYKKEGAVPTRLNRRLVCRNSGWEKDLNRQARPFRKLETTATRKTFRHRPKAHRT